MLDKRLFKTHLDKTKISLGPFKGLEQLGTDLQTVWTIPDKIGLVSGYSRLF